MNKEVMHVDMEMSVEDEEMDMEIEDLPGGGTSDYMELYNLPQINGVTLIGNKTSDDLNVQEKGEYLTEENVKRERVNIDFSNYFK